MLDWKLMLPVAPVPGDIRTGCFLPEPQVKPGGMYIAARS